MQAENRASEAERTVSKLQKEVDRLEGMNFARQLYYFITFGLWEILMARKVTDFSAAKPHLVALRFFPGESRFLVTYAFVLLGMNT